MPNKATARRQTTTFRRIISPLATRSGWHTAALIGIAVFFIGGAIGHFALARFFVAIVPDYVPMPRLVVAVSGICELAGALGILLPRTRRAAGFGLMVLIVAVFPANVHMALNAELYPDFAPWLLYARLPLQLVLLAWVAFAMRLAYATPRSPAPPQP